MNRLIVFRVDASLQIGIGHVMRCLTLADALSVKGADCHFICRAHEGNLVEFIRGKGYKTHSLPISAIEGEALLPSATDSSSCSSDLPHSQWLGATQAEDAAACIPILAAHRADWLIVDHYALDTRWQDALRSFYLKLMIIDDLADRSHSCDLLLDQTYGREERDYYPLVPANCQLLCGSKYALLRPEFELLRSYSLQRRSNVHLRQILITMGGVDKDNATGKVLRALVNSQLPSCCHIMVVMGATAPWLEEVERQSHDMPWPTQVMVGVNDMAKLMADSDLAIGAAGATAWEMCALGLPSIIVALAENQDKIAKTLFDAGAVFKLDAKTLNSSAPISGQCFDPKLLGSISRSAARITDGLGVSKVIASLIGI